MRRGEALELAGDPARVRLRGEYTKSGNPRVFPWNPVTSYAMWHTASRRTGFSKRDQETNRHQVHPHALRKFFRTRLASVTPVDVVEAVMGHEGYLTEVYRRYAEGDLPKFYEPGESAMWIFTEAGEVTELRKEVEEQRDQLQSIVNVLTAENLELKSRVARTHSHRAREAHRQPRVHCQADTQDPGANRETRVGISAS